MYAMVAISQSATISTLKTKAKRIFINNSWISYYTRPETALHGSHVSWPPTQFSAMARATPGAAFNAQLRPLAQALVVVRFQPSSL